MIKVKQALEWAVPRIFLFPSLRKSLLAVLLGLLVLAPFLHGHIGASNVSGFHLDGLAVAHAPAPADGHSLDAADDESPALGVAISLPKSADDGWGWIGWVGLLILAVPAGPAAVRWRPRAVRAQPARLHHRAGWPPPTLAPPVSPGN